MAKKSVPPAPEKPALLVSREEAADRIQTQIDEGEVLLAAEPASTTELDDLKDQRRIWSDYNRELLTHLFTSSAVADEYAEFRGGAFRWDPSFSDLVGYYKDDLQTSLTRLRSIHRRLELFPAPEAAATSVVHPREITGDDVFLVHGHNEAAKEAVARFIERFGLKVVILHEQPDKGRTVIEKFEDHSEVGYAVVLLTADDLGSIKSEPEGLQPRARQNVLLELGYFIGVLGRNRVCALREEGVEVPSDLSGVLYVPLDDAGAWKLRLAGEMKAAGLDVDMNLAI